MNKIIIDGYNMIHRVPELRQFLRASLEDARNELIQRIKSYLLDKAIEIIIVFDGSEAPPGLPPIEQHRRLKVIFSKRPFKADPVIISLISGSKKRQSLIIVSDDGEIKRAARSGGAMSISTSDFYSRITDASFQKRATRTVTGILPMRNCSSG
ncbi:NYN domain-containing protein [bacterium]|nr:NYN domain-containing protein [bacterium]